MAEYGGSLHLTTRSELTTEEVAPIFTTIPEEEYQELPDLPEQTLKIYEDHFPSLFGRVTPTRIEDTLHELTTLKGLDGKSYKDWVGTTVKNYSLSLSLNWD